jgi:hypothetical protein
MAQWARGAFIILQFTGKRKYWLQDDKVFCLLWWNAGNTATIYWSVASRAEVLAAKLAV